MKQLIVVLISVCLFSCSSLKNIGDNKLDRESLTDVELEGKRKTLENNLRQFLNRSFPDDITTLEIEFRFTNIDSDNSIVITPYNSDGLTDELHVSLIDNLFSRALTEKYFYSEVNLERKLFDKIAKWIYKSWKDLDLSSSYNIAISQRDGEKYFLLNEGKWVEADYLYPLDF